MFIYTCCFTDSTKRFLKELHSAMEAWKHEQCNAQQFDKVLKWFQKQKNM